MDTRYFSDKVVKWYELNKRDLPWRETNDPYRIWLSEIILQQTRVNQGLPYYLKFLEKFPTVGDLAKASEEEVLRAWQGLGYYTRARNLHKCAREVVEKFNGVFPNSYQSLKELRGVGDYTAAAVASICFGERVPVLDGNVYRVLSRVFGVDEEISSTKGQKTFKTLATKLIADPRPDLYNQAVMEFGALHCTPKNPTCQPCIFSAKCFANRNNLQQVLPVKTKVKKPRKRYFYYFIFRKGKSYGMKRREGKDIWFGLYDFSLIEKTRPAKVERLIREIGNNFQNGIMSGEVSVSAVYKHVLSHQIIHARFIIVNNTAPEWSMREPLKFYSTKKIAALPKPVLITRFLTDHQLL